MIHGTEEDTLRQVHGLILCARIGTVRDKTSLYQSRSLPDEQD